MTFARTVGLLTSIAALAACSGNLGGGQSTLPGTPQNGTTNTQGVAPPTPTASPLAASGVMTLGDTTSQALPAVMGWGGTIAFVKPNAAPSPTITPKPGASPIAVVPADASVSLGVTAAVVDPSDAPRFNPPARKGRRADAKHPDNGEPKGLFFITLLATSDVTLGQYPKIAVDVPRDVATKYRDETFALALYDPETKAKSYRLAVAERDLTSPAPGPAPLATAIPTPMPTSTPPGTATGPTAFTPPPVGMGLDSATLPPERVAFQATAATLSLKANRPVVFALYAVAPQPSPSPVPSPTAGKAGPPKPPPPAPAAAPSPSGAAPSPSAAAPAASVVPASSAPNPGMSPTQ